MIFSTAFPTTLLSLIHKTIKIGKDNQTSVIDLEQKVSTVTFLSYGLPINSQESPVFYDVRSFYTRKNLLTDFFVSLVSLTCLT